MEKRFIHITSYKRIHPRLSLAAVDGVFCFKNNKIGFAQVVVATDIHDMHRIVVLTDHTQKDKLSRIAVSLFGVPKREARRIIAKYQAQ